MDLNNPDKIRVKDILQSFSYWPKIITLFWHTQKSYFIVILLISVLQGSFPFISLLITQELINSIVLSWEKGFQLVLYFFIAFISITLFREVTSIIQVYYQSMFQTLFTNKINVMIMEKANELGLRDFENPTIQDQLKRAQNESGHRPFQTFQKILMIITNVVSITSSIMLLFYWKWWVALIFVFLPLLSFYSYLKLGQLEFVINWRRAPKWRESWYLTYIMTYYLAFKEIKMYNVGSYLINKYKTIIMNFYNEDKKILKKRLTLSFVFELINLSVLASVIYLVLRAAYLKEILIGNVVGYIQAINLTLSSSQSIARGLISLSQDNLYIGQLFSFFSVKSSDPIKNSSVKEKEEELSDFVIENIEFKNVSYRYSREHPYVLNNININFCRGESYVIVGENGSGKSTLAKIISQLYDGYEGRIMINGTPIEELDREKVKNRIGAVFQDFMKYEFIVRENIGLGNTKYMHDDKRLLDELSRVGLSELVSDLPNQLDTQLGSWFSGSHQLSGGQWQRMAIARAYLSDADVYLMDEPSASLDPKSEHEVFKKLNELAKDKIGIFITHRLTSVKHVSKIIVLDRGNIVEQGSHKELMLLNGTYARMYNLQSTAYSMNL